MDAHLAQGGARGSGEPIAKEIREPLERSLVGVLAEIEQQQVGRILLTRGLRFRLLLSASHQRSAF